MVNISTYITESRSRSDAAHLESDFAVKQAMTGGRASFGTSGSPLSAFAEFGGAGRQQTPFLGYSQQNTAARQYQHFKDIPYAAIRPIACKIASLPLNVGVAKKRSSGDGGKAGGFRTKGGTDAGRAELAAVRSAMRKNAGRLYELDDLGVPFYVKAMANSEAIDPIDDHVFLDDIADPNPYMTAWASMYCTVVSLYVTGLAHWWMCPDPEDGGTQFWYIPTTWVTPIPTEKSPFGKFKVRPPWFAGEGWEVLEEDMVRFTFPDPANPLSVFAPLQSQAMAVDVDDMLQKAQHTSMRDGPRPQVVLTAGRLPDMPGIPGSGQRPVLTSDQRKQLVAAIKMAYAGPTKYGEPFIIDGLIENITPFGRTPAEMDFLGSSKLTKDRVYHGLGVNPIVTGEIEGANRASAVVADSYLYALVVNPLAVMMSQTLTKGVGPRYKDTVRDGRKIVIWFTPAEAEDPTLTLGRFNAVVKLPGVMTKGEVRKYANTGVLKIEGRDDDDDPAVEAPPEPPAGGMEVGGGAPEPPAEGGGAGGGGKPVATAGKPVATAGKPAKGEVEKPEKPAVKPIAKPAATVKPKKDFDPNQSRTLAGTFADGGRIIPSDEVLERVRRSPQNNGREDVDWFQFGQANCIRGDFREWSIPAATMHSLVKAGSLQLRAAMTEETISDKYDTGKRNPVIVTRNPGGKDGKAGNTPPLLVVDGNHSLTASLRKWAVNPREDGYDDAVKCLISDEAAEWMGLDLQTTKPQEG